MLEKQQKRIRRHKRVRAKIKGSETKPRLCVFKSSKYIYAQLINDENGKTIVSVNDNGLKASKSTEIKGNKEKKAFEVGKLVAEKALAKKIDSVVFDRGGYKYHGRVKCLADGARQGGLKF